MTEVRFLPPAVKFLKKLKDKKLKALYKDAIDKILQDHTIGELKSGDLQGIYSYDIYYITKETPRQYRNKKCGISFMLCLIFVYRNGIHKAIHTLPSSPLRPAVTL